MLQKKAAKEREEEKCLLLAEKFRNLGFESLTRDELDFLDELVQSHLLKERIQSGAEFELCKMALIDEKYSRYSATALNAAIFFQNKDILDILNNSSLQQQAMLKAMNVNLSNISNKTAGIKAASVFTGLAAARHVGERFAEDFVGSDD